MANLYFSAIRESGKSLALKPLTNRAAATIDPQPTDLRGYFLVETDGCDNSILARVETEDAAVKLAQLLDLR